MIGFAGELTGVLMLRCEALSATRHASKLPEMPIEGRMKSAPDEECKHAPGEASNYDREQFSKQPSEPSRIAEAAGARQFWPAGRENKIGVWAWLNRMDDLWPGGAH